MTCLTPGCHRERIVSARGDIVHAHCSACEARILREAFGPVSWTDRALTNTLPPLVVGGLPLRPDSPSGGRPAVTPERHASAPRQGASALPAVQAG